MEKKKINLPKILLGIPLALISLRVYLGAILGYFFAKILAGRLDSIIFNIGSHQFHFHHWLMGLIGLIFTLLFSFSPLINYLIYGFLGGLVFEGISNYPDWYKIITRRKEKEVL